MARTFLLIHRLLGLLLVPHLLLYAVSAFEISHPQWFDKTPQVTHAEVVVEPDVLDDVAALSARLRDLGLVRGELTSADDTGAKWRATWPGTVYEVTLDRETHRVEVEAKEGPTIALLNRLHQFAGVANDDLRLDVWGWLVLGTSVGVFVLALTGLVLWWRLATERALGLVVILGVWSFCAVLLVAVRFA